MESGVERVLELFREIDAIPRCSGNEENLRAWIGAWATGLGFESRTDSCGNLLVKVPATPGCESAPGVILQGHMDMVCEKTPESSHDFATDPIRVIHEGDWIHAEATTLGADNGIALALGMALAESSDRPHPGLDLLFTVEEETGLVGALNLDREMLSADILLNLDSDKEAEFTVGCSGGRTTTLEMPLIPTPGVYGGLAVTVSAEGMTGGHSGIDIHKNRANANRVLAAILREFRPFRLVEIHGGTAPNAIPREAQATILSNPDEAPGAAEAARNAAEALKEAYASTDPALRILFNEARCESGFSAVSPATSSVIVDLLLSLPNGVVAMDTEMEGLVETSCNLSRIDMHRQAREFRAMVSQRSSNIPRLNELTGRIEAVASLAGCRTETGRGYPAWQPRLDSPVLTRSRKLYEHLFGAAPGIRIVHAGLECGVIGSLRPGIDMISFGPTIQNPHSPAERMSRSSVERTLLFLTELLRSLAQDPPAAS